MNYKDLSRPLEISDVDFRIQSINNGGYATILAYKDARVDMIRLDEVLTPIGWQRDYKLIDGKLFCGVGIYNDKANQWIWKWDVGTESNTEKEKGQASDSFKRACFNLGIGRELYSYPFISVKLQQDEWEKKKDYSGKEKPTATFNLKLKDWKWYSEFTDDVLSFLAAKDQNGTVRYKWGTMKPKKTEPEYKAASGAVADAKIDESSVHPLSVEEAHAPIVVDGRGDAVDQYFKVFGKKPHGKATIERIMIDIEAELASRNSEHIIESDNITTEEPSIKEPEKVEEIELIEATEDDIDELDTILHLIDSIDRITDPKEFVKWAKESVETFKDIDTQDVIDGFKDACNSHYAKLVAVKK